MQMSSSGQRDLRVLVTGASGFLGRNLMPILHEYYGRDSVVGVSSKDYNLLEQVDYKKLFSDLKPQILVHLAAYSGGIGANDRYPADFFYRNLMFLTLGFELAQQFGVEKIIYPMGGCSYPALATSPIDEDQMWNGFPQKESAGYSMAKKMGLVAAMSYKKQHNLNSVVLIPGNMYGPHDNFIKDESHVIPAMIRRFYEARLYGAHEVVMWGTGSPVRDFVYVGDVAGTFPYFMEHYSGMGPVNISSGIATSIKELANLVSELVGFEGNIRWDTEKPDGQKIKTFSTRRLESLGLGCKTNLREGLTKTIDWFIKHYDKKSDGIRL